MSVVVDYLFDNPLLVGEHSAQFLRLSVAKFRHQFSPGFEVSASLRGQHRVIIEPGRAAIQRLSRIEVANFRLQRGDFSTRDVRRI